MTTHTYESTALADAPTLAPTVDVLRLRILAAMGDGAESPKAIAEQLAAEPLGNIAYHVRTMAATGLLEKTGERQVRGATAHDYRITDAGRAYVAALYEAAVAAQAAIVVREALA